ncbi:MAG: S1 RNA-binding domain-containing protein [Clostridia bacterium]|nr:S1 RNA-binding domain-containing protein [Clostridia bacterium]MBQ4574360.1 S1 RNA-binding domain-containing protein [Clostridia bacterium]
MQFEVGTILEGRVTGITNFGAFISLPENKTGMVHISEISTGFVKDIKDHLKLDQSVRVKIIAIDEKGKIALSIKQTIEVPPKPAPKAPASNTPPVEFRPNAPKASEGSDSFEDMMSRFKKLSEDKLSDFKRASEVKRTSSRRK